MELACEQFAEWDGLLGSIYLRPRSMLNDLWWYAREARLQYHTFLSCKLVQTTFGIQVLIDEDSRVTYSYCGHARLLLVPSKDR